ncbi:MAG: hypothetical protein QW717_04340 [Candidatus Bathyarchaeia archaeon]
MAEIRQICLPLQLYTNVYEGEKGMANCPLCSLDMQKEKIFYQDDLFIVLRTAKLKGHRERIMIVYKQHQNTISYEEYERALKIVSDIGREVFKYAPKFVILDGTFASIKDHWHLVASDLDPKSEDFDQILATRWIKVLDNTHQCQT